MKAKDLQKGDLFMVRNGTRHYQVINKYEKHITARVLNSKNSRKVHNEEEVFDCEWSDEY